MPWNIFLKSSGVMAVSFTSHRFVKIRNRPQSCHATLSDSDDCADRAIQDFRRDANMTIFRALVLGLALASLAGCTATIRLLVTNQKPDTISVSVADKSARIGQSETKALIVPALNLPLRIKSGRNCSAFQLPLATLPGSYYRPGLRHSVEVTLVEGDEMRIEPLDGKDLDAILVSSTECEESDSS